MKRSARAGGAPRQPEKAGGGPAGNGATTARAAIIVPVLTRQPRASAEDARPRMTRSPQARLDEAVGLAGAIELDPVIAIDGAPVGDGRPGRTALALRATFFDVAEKVPA